MPDSDKAEFRAWYTGHESEGKRFGYPAAIWEACAQKWKERIYQHVGRDFQQLEPDEALSAWADAIKKDERKRIADWYEREGCNESDVADAIRALGD